MMLRITEFPLQVPSGIHIHPSMSSLFHGALMEIVDSDTAAALHTLTMRPYSQSVFWDIQQHRPIWRIATLQDQAYHHIIEPLLAREDPVWIKQKQIAVIIGPPNVLAETTYEAVADHIFQQAAPPRGVDITFMTTTSCKHDGEYDIFPCISRLYGSILRRWNEFSPTVSLQQEGLEKTLAQYCHMSKYDLHSQAYSLESTVIYGFCGTMRLQFRGNDMIKRLQGLAWSFAPFAGIGIKTALGMGTVQAKLRW
jgi:CRISPR-associated endoribonuclease Cas6